MAFPVVEARASGRDAEDVTDHPITLPDGIVAGELLLVIFSCDGSVVPTESSGLWTRQTYSQYNTYLTAAIFYKVATGGDSLTIVTTSQEASHISFRISGYDPDLWDMPVRTVFQGSSADSDPPILGNPRWPTMEDILWIVTRSGDAQVVATAAPADFSNLQTIAAATPGGASTNTAERLLRTNLLDPGPFTSDAEQWVCYTISILPPWVGGWQGTIAGVTNPAKVIGADVASIAKVKGVAST